MVVCYANSTSFTLLFDVSNLKKANKKLTRATFSCNFNLKIDHLTLRSWFMEIAKGIYLKSLSTGRIFMKMIKWFHVYFLIPFLAKDCFWSIKSEKIQRIVYLCKSMKICTRLSVAVLFPVLCIIMFFIEHLAQVCIAKTNVQLRFRFFVFDSFYSCFNSQCTLETTSLEISVYCPYPIYNYFFHVSFWIIFERFDGFLWRPHKIFDNQADEF